MAMAEKLNYAHITFNEHGEAVIKGTRFKVKFLAADYLYRGWDAKTIHEQYPHLTLGQIHSALAYSADHEEEMRRQIDDGERLAEELRPQLESAALREKLAAAAARRGDAG